MNKEDKKEDNLYKLRHTLAHVLAKAVLEFDPEAKLAIGPPVDNGFYYDFEFSKEVGESELKDFDKRMKKIISAGFEPSVKEISIDEASAPVRGMKQCGSSQVHVVNHRVNFSDNLSLVSHLDQ